MQRGTQASPGKPAPCPSGSRSPGLAGCIPRNRRTGASAEPAKAAGGTCTPTWLRPGRLGSQPKSLFVSWRKLRQRVRSGPRLEEKAQPIPIQFPPRRPSCSRRPIPGAPGGGAGGRQGAKPNRGALTWPAAPGAGRQQGAAQTQPRGHEQQPPRPHCPRLGAVARWLALLPRLSRRRRRGPALSSSSRGGPVGRAGTALPAGPGRGGVWRRSAGRRAGGSGGAGRAGKGAPRCRVCASPPAPPRRPLPAAPLPRGSATWQRLSRGAPPAPLPATARGGSRTRRFFLWAPWTREALGDSGWRGLGTGPRGLGGGSLGLSLPPGGTDGSSDRLIRVRPGRPAPTETSVPPVHSAVPRASPRPVWKLGI